MTKSTIGQCFLTVLISISYRNVFNFKQMIGLDDLENFTRPDT